MCNKLSLQGLMWCDTKLMSNIFYEYVDVDERKKTTLIHDGIRRQDTAQLFIMKFLGCRKSNIYFLFLCLGVFCLFVGL
jgi:hypothetical protein